MAENAKSYSALVIIDPAKGGSDDEAKTMVNSIIAENKGEVVKENIMGKKNLAYPIKKQTEGFYYEVFFSATPDTIAKINRQFQINTSILRSIISTEK